MIISHKHRFIFLKTIKTAGTSVEIALSKFCGPEDILATLAKRDEAARAKLGYRGAQNHEAPMAEYHLKDYWRRLSGRKKKRFVSQSPAIEVRDFLGHEIWEQYFKFCIERNPWDRVLSHYYWRTKDRPDSDLDSYLASDEIFRLKRHGIELYSIDGQPAVDRVCLYESLTDELEAVRQILALPESLSLPQAKSGYRKDRRHYRDILTENQKNRIAAVFSEEIERYGYQY